MSARVERGRGARGGVVVAGMAFALSMSAASFAPAAAADALYLSATNKLDYRRLDQGDEREEAFRNRLEVTANQGPFGGWVRLQSLGVSNLQLYDPFGAGDDVEVGTKRVDETAVSRRLFTVDTERFQAAAGDFSWVFGRGMALSVFEDEELNFDSRLEGVRGSWEHDRGTLTALGGTRDGNRFRGLFLEPNTFGPVRLGASAVEAWGGETGTNIRAREQQVSGLAEVTLESVSLYGEVAHREFPGTTEIPAESSGRGAFVAAVASVRGFTFSGEFRDYEKFDHEFHDPPTALKQHTWTLLNRVNGVVQTDIDDDDVQGWLAEGEYSFGLFSSARASYSHAEPDDGESSFWEAYGEAKGTWQERAFVTAAASESEFDYLGVFEERIGGFGELVFEVDDRNSLSAGVEWVEATESDESTAAFAYPREYRDRIFSLSYGRSPWVSLTVLYEDTTDENETADEWVMAQAEIVLGDSQDLIVSFGKERGGWKCSGGICFFEPEFEGLKVRWTARY